MIHKIRDLIFSTVILLPICTYANPDYSLEDKLISAADDKAQAGQREQAIELLRHQHFFDTAETQRLIRLAALNLIEDPQQAWNYLAEASKKDPHSADVHLFKASLLEAAGKNSNAQSEYILAIKSSPNNPFYRDALADFYIRTKQYSPAIQILNDSLHAPSLDLLWLKAIFWNKAAIPLKHEFNAHKAPEGPLHPLISYLATLPTGVFWNESTFARLPEKDAYLYNEQETYWLRLLSALKGHNEIEALHLIDTNPFFTVSYAPELEKSLKTILLYRSASKENAGTFPSPLVQQHDTEKQAQDFLKQLATLADLPLEHIVGAIPSDLKRVLMTREALALPFLAYGWNEAALQLHNNDELSDAFPEWVAVKYTEALRQNRTEAVAFDFAMNQKMSAPLALMVAEMASKLEKNEAVLGALLGAYKEQNEYGVKASLLLEPLLTEKGNFRMARSVIEAHPELNNSREGKEILARIALQDQEPLVAVEIYRQIEKVSPEAKSFLATKAFAEKDWARARQLTEELLEIYPNDAMLSENLERIEQEENKPRPKR